MRCTYKEISFWPIRTPLRAVVRTGRPGSPFLIFASCSGCRPRWIVRVDLRVLPKEKNHCAVISIWPSKPPAPLSWFLLFSSTLNSSSFHAFPSVWQLSERTVPSGEMTSGPPHSPSGTQHSVHIKHPSGTQELIVPCTPQADLPLPFTFTYTFSYENQTALHATMGEVTSRLSLNIFVPLLCYEALTVW